MARSQVILGWLAQWLISAVFLYSGVVKLLDPTEFLQSIEAYRLVPYSVAWVMAYYLPPLEIVVGAALLFRPWRRASALLVAALMLVFMLALGAAWVRGLDINCGCFGSEGEPSNYWLVLLRDLALCFLAVVVAVGADAKFSMLSSRPQRALVRTGTANHTAKAVRLRHL